MNLVFETKTAISLLHLNTSQANKMLIVESFVELK